MWTGGQVHIPKVGRCIRTEEKKLIPRLIAWAQERLGYSFRPCLHQALRSKYPITIDEATHLTRSVRDVAALEAISTIRPVVVQEPWVRGIKVPREKAPNED